MLTGCPVQGLTEKQSKLADRVRRNENRVANLQKEYDAISVRLQHPLHRAVLDWTGPVVQAAVNSLLRWCLAAVRCPALGTHACQQGPVLEPSRPSPLAGHGRAPG